MFDLKEFRKYYNLTQKELSEILKVGETTISSWETGRRKPTSAGLAWICFRLQDWVEKNGKKRD